MLAESDDFNELSARIVSLDLEIANLKIKIAQLTSERWKVVDTMRLNCEHDYIYENPSGIRDNGEYWKTCKKCGLNI